MVWMLAKVSPLDEVTTKALFQHPFVFTNHMLMITLGTILLLIVMPLALRRKGMVLSGFGNAIEAICLYLREEVVRPFLHDKTDKYIGYLWTMFYFILTLNLLGMIPLNRIVWMVTGGKENHLGGAATANIYVTGTLAMVAFFLFHVAGIVENGLVHYIKTFCPKVPWPMMPFMFFMEVVSSFVRMFSLAIRLFANILAGPLIGLAPDFGRALVPGGHLLLAGLLETQEPQVRAACRKAGLRLARRLVNGDWSILWLRKRASPAFRPSRNRPA